jgi:hypothetical protein
MNDPPLFHSRYTLWTIVGAALVVLAAAVRVLVGAPEALVAIAGGAIIVGALGTALGTEPGYAGALWSDADVAEEVTD